ncbi:hypothetical protein WJX81_007671 [Elliptochloris bilobata]|uniref:F-box domain-containing protein n=1 Tax=Elliptochloris bilobata TaxID=381761 RepID=A0AAW1S463_9CHLO
MRAVAQQTRPKSVPHPSQQTRRGPWARRLNPCASVFVPRHGWCDAGGAGAWRPSAAGTPTVGGQQSTEHVLLADLPQEVLASIVTYVDDPVDVASMAVSIKQLHAILCQAPLRLRMPSWATGGGSVRKLLRGIADSFKGAQELDLRGAPVEDADVAAALASLPAERKARALVPLVGTQRGFAENREYTAAEEALAYSVPEAGYPGWEAGAPAMLAAAAGGLPNLAVLELTFFPPAAVAAAAAMLGDRVAVWDFCREADIAAAAALLAAARGGRGAASGSAGTLNSTLDLPPAAIGLALEAATNCSSATRQTPLHVATVATTAHVAPMTGPWVYEQSAPRMRALLALGAAVDARDRNAATPLFAACEADRHVAAAELLAAGADAAMRNAQGEAPLYIAALRGNGTTLKLLLDHMQRADIPWMEAELYGDGWTPLMAAAVGKRRDITAHLLRAAGPHAAALAGATNRYGQSALHIAARQGSLPVIRLLLAAGAGVVADNAGTMPDQIAVQNNHPAAAALLQAASGPGPKPNPAPAGGGRRRRGRRAQVSG